MKKTQKSHNSTVRMSLSLEELSAYIEDRLSPKERASVDKFLRENPLYQETLAILDENYDKDPDFLEKFATAETHFENALDKEIERLPVKGTPSFDPISKVDPVPTGSSWEVSSPADSSTQEPTSWYRQNWVKLAASLVLIGGIMLVGYQQFRSPSDSQLASAYLTHFKDPMASLSQLEDKAYQLYENKAYSEAVPAFEQLISQTDRDKAFKHKMFLGVSLLQAKQNIDAFEPLEEIIDHGESIYVGPAKWYLSLAYLKEGNTDMAIRLLEELVQESGNPEKGLLSTPYLAKAQELLSRLS